MNVDVRKSAHSDPGSIPGVSTKSRIQEFRSIVVQNIIGNSELLNSRIMDSGFWFVMTEIFILAILAVFVYVLLSFARKQNRSGRVARDRILRRAQRRDED